MVFSLGIIKWYKGDDDERIAKNYSKRESDSEIVNLRNGTPSRMLRSTLIFLFGVLIIFSVWGYLAWHFNNQVASLLHFPEPIETIQSLYEYIFNGKLMLGRTIWDQLFASLTRWFTAFALAAIAGVSLGIILGCARVMYPIGMAPIGVIQTVPGMAWIPVAILIFGLGDSAAVFIIFLITFVIITINVSGGIRRIPETYIRAADMMGAKKLVRVFKILLPFAMLDIVVGLRLGMGSAWRTLIAAEMLIATGIGLGYSMVVLRFSFDYISAFACIMLVGVIGLLMDKIIFVNIERYVRHKLGMDEDV